MAEERKGPTTTVVGRLYNNMVGSLEYGYFQEDMGYISISPVIPGQEGKSNPAAGEKMYDHDKKIFIALNAKDIVKMRVGFPSVEGGEHQMFVIPHMNSRKGEGKVLTIGLDEANHWNFWLQAYVNNVEVNSLNYLFSEDDPDNTLYFDPAGDENAPYGQGVVVLAELEALKDFLFNSLPRFINREGRYDHVGGSSGGGQSAPSQRPTTSAPAGARSRPVVGGGQQGGQQGGAPSGARSRPVSPSGGAARQAAPAQTVKNPEELFAQDSNQQ